MNILACTRITHLHGGLGGMELASRAVYDSLAKLGHSVTVLTTSLHPEQHKPKTTLENGVRYIFLPDCEPKAYSGEYHNAVKNYFYSEENQTIDLIHSTSAAAQSLCRNGIVPVIATWHGTFLEQELDKVCKYKFLDGKEILPSHFETFLLKTFFGPVASRIKREYLDFDAHIVISEFMKNIVSTYGAKEKDIFVVENSVPDTFYESRKVSREEARARFNIPNDAYVIGLVGRLEAMKGHEVFCKAMHDVDSQRTSVLVVGSGEASHLYDSIDQHVLKTRVPFSDMPLAYRAMDLFVNPTLRYSGFDMTVLESIDAGVPCLVSNLPQYQSFHEALVQQKITNTVSVFRTGDHNSLSTAINRSKSISFRLDDKRHSLSAVEVGMRYTDIFQKIIK